MKHNKLVMLFVAIYCLFYSVVAAAVSEYIFNPKEEHHSLYTPKGKGTFPAVILLHASSGIEETNHNWAKILRDQGYVVYVIDSFKPRGYKDRKSIGWEKATNAQLSDVAPAYEYLISLPAVDTTRIGLIGFSMGGFTVLQAMQASLHQKYPFKAAASFYPVCKRLPADTELKGPLQIFIGKNDDRSTLKDCEMLVKKQKEKEHQISMITYQNALHGFDNPALSQSMEVTDEYGETYHVGFNKDDQKQAITDLIYFFKTTLK